MKLTNLQKMVLTAIFTSIAVLGSFLNFPVFGTKCSPVQHMINILSAVILNPFYAVVQAVLASTIRNLFGLGTLFAFPGSIFGAFLASVLFLKSKKLGFAVFGELFGTSILGGITGFFIGKFLLGKPLVLLPFIFSFFLSSFAGAVCVFAVLKTLRQTGILHLDNENSTHEVVKHESFNN